MRIFLMLSLILASGVGFTAEVGEHHDAYDGHWIPDIDLKREITYLDHVSVPGGGTYSLAYDKDSNESMYYFIKAFNYDGTINTNFGVNGYKPLSIITIDESEISGAIEVDSWNSRLFVAVSISDAFKLYQFDYYGVKKAEIVSNYADMISHFNGPVSVNDVRFLSSFNNWPMVAVVNEVILNNLGDSDFGVTLFEIVGSGLQTSNVFGDRGRAMCAFDFSHYNSYLYSPDVPQSVTYQAQTDSIILSGTAYEYEGRNQAFCEFSNTGTLVNQWSSQGFSVFQSFQEWGTASYLDENVFPPQLYVAGGISGAGGLDFAVFRYTQDVLGDWIMDTTFGSNGVLSIPFKSIDGTIDSSDLASRMVRQKNGHFVLGGTGSWSQNQKEYSRIQLASFNSSGELLTSWGNNGQLTPIWNDEVNGGFPKEKMGGLSLAYLDEKLVISATGQGLNQGADWKIGLMAKLYNDPLFQSGFD